MDPKVLYCKPSPLGATSLSALTPPPHDGELFLKFEITNAYVRELSMADEEDEHFELHRCSDTEFRWRIQKDAVIQQTASSRFILLGILSAMNVHKAAQSSMVDQILACALDMATRTHTTEKVLAMSVRVIVARSEKEDPLNTDDEEECDHNIESDEDEEGKEEDDADAESLEFTAKIDLIKSKKKFRK